MFLHVASAAFVVRSLQRTELSVLATWWMQANLLLEISGFKEPSSKSLVHCLLRCNSQMIVSCNGSRSAWHTFKWSHKNMHRLFMSQDNYLPFDKIYSLWYPQVRGLPLWGPHIQMSSHSSLSSPTIQICHPAEVFHWSMGQQLTRILVPWSHSQLHKILSINFWSLFSYLIMLATMINEQSSLVSLFISKFFVQVKNSK